MTVLTVPGGTAGDRTVRLPVPWPTMRGTPGNAAATAQTGVKERYTASWQEAGSPVVTARVATTIGRSLPSIATTRSGSPWRS